MGKIFNSKSGIVFGIIIVAILLSFLLIRSFQGSREIQASISAIEINTGEYITYADSTRGATEWIWEFGNGAFSETRSGTYRFDEAGRYKLRLRVDNKLEKIFEINVKQPVRDNSDLLIRIQAPQQAMQGEFILFTGVGNDNEWRWEFGESGMVDSREKNALYSYTGTGQFEVLLSTENTRYPIRHHIEILPKYAEEDSTDVMSVIALDIKNKLQTIAKGKSFNSCYNHILQKYLCNNPNAIVSVNNAKRNDFYSYCQGLRVTGRNTAIKTVVVQMEDPNGKCIESIIVIQEDK